MAEASIVGMEIVLFEVERIIKYRFVDHNLLFSPLGRLSTDHVEGRPNIPRLGFLVRMGQLALDAVGWGLRHGESGGNPAEPFSTDSLAHFALLRGAWDEDANECGLWPYLERREGSVGPRS